IAEAGDRAVAASRASIPADVPKLGVIENIERLRSEFERNGFSNLKTFVDRHVKVGLPRITSDISARISKGQSLWRDERARVDQQRSELRSAEVGRARAGNSRVGIAKNIWP